MASVNNIERMREARGWSRPELGKRMKPPTSGQQIERIEKGQRKLSQDWIDKAAAAFGVSPEAIISPGAELPDLPPTRDASAGDETVEIVSLDLSLSMGPGTLIEDFVEGEPVKFDLGMVRNITRTPPSRLRLVKGIGDSMEPTLRTSDQVMVDINERALARINGIYWIDHLGTHGIKRLRAASRGRIMVISDNAGVDNFEVNAEDVRIEGRVIWFAREL